MKKFDYACLIYTVMLLIFGFDDEPKRNSVSKEHKPVVTLARNQLSTANPHTVHIAAAIATAQQTHKPKIVTKEF